MNFPKKIKEKRLNLGETQEEFGKRFGRTSTAVSLWESGERKAPYEVLEMLFNGTETIKVITCPACKGKGTLKL